MLLCMVALMVASHAVIRRKMTSKTLLLQLQLLLLAVAAICYYSVDAFSISSSRGLRTTHHSGCKLKTSRQTRLFQGSSTTASLPIITSHEELAKGIIDTNKGSGNNVDALTTKSLQQEQQHATATTAKTTIKATTSDKLIPSTWSQALHHFFLKDIGPPLVILTISGFILTRIHILPTTPFSLTELSIGLSAILLWWVQEYIFHRVLLHSPFQWIGKSIHATHHDKDYFHISIDPPALLLGWLFTAHFLIKAVLLPQYHLCLTATIGYSLAGLVYEWSHYIVHTKVKPRLIPITCPSYKQLSLVDRRIVQPLMRGYAKMRDNHIRHHLIDGRYWYAFSVVEMDDLFGTNPNVKMVKSELKEKKTKESNSESFQ